MKASPQFLKKKPVIRAKRFSHCRHCKPNANNGICNAQHWSPCNICQPEEVEARADTSLYSERPLGRRQLSQNELNTKENPDWGKSLKELRE